MNEHIKKVIKEIKEHRRSNPTAHTYTMPLPSVYNTQGIERTLSESEKAEVTKQIDGLRASVVAAYDLM